MVGPGVTSHSDRRNGPEDGIPASDVVEMHGYPSGSLTISPDVAMNHTWATPQETFPRQVSITGEEARVLGVILSRDFTAFVTHGGLKGLLTLTDEEVATFRGLVNKITLV